MVSLIPTIVSTAGAGVPPDTTSPMVRPVQSARDCRTPRSILRVVEHRQERLLGDLDVPHLLHTLLALFLLFQQLPFSRDVAAIALRGHVLAERRDRLAGDHPAADGRLD